MRLEYARGKVRFDIAEPLGCGQRLGGQGALGCLPEENRMLDPKRRSGAMDVVFADRIWNSRHQVVLNSSDVTGSASSDPIKMKGLCGRASGGRSVQRADLTNPIDRSALIKQIRQHFTLNMNPWPLHLVVKVLLDTHAKNSTRKTKVEQVS